MPISNQVRWVGVAPTDPAEVIPVADRKLGFSKTDTGSVTVSAGSSYQALNVSGKGKFYFFLHHYSSGIPASYAHLRLKVDTNDIGSEEYWIDIHNANFLGFTSVGPISLGAFAGCVINWDTTNNIYNVYGYGDNLYFSSSLTATLDNDYTSDAIMRAIIEFFVYESSIRIKFEKIKPIGNDITELHRMLRRDYGDVSFVCERWECKTGPDLEPLGPAKPILEISVADDVLERHGDKIIDRLVKENIVRGLAPGFRLPGRHPKKHFSF